MPVDLIDVKDAAGTTREVRTIPATQPVSVTSLPLPTGGATQTTLADILAKITADPATQTTLVAILAKIISAPATEAKQDTANAALAAIEAAVEGSLPVTGTFWQATQPVSGTLTMNAGSGTLAVSLASLPAGTNNIGDVDVLSLPALPAGTNTIGKVTLTPRVYETVAASQTTQALGATGATGDHLVSLLIVPATTSPGAVSIKDGAGSAITVFAGGAASVGSLVPFAIPIDAASVAGAWQVTTGANVSVFATGTFT